MARDAIKRHLLEWRKDALPLLLFLLLPLLAFPELFLGQNTLYRGDLTRIHYPQHTLAAEQWKSGQVPLWNPYVRSGGPLLAEAQIGVLQPMNAVFLLPIPPYRALTLFVTLNLTLAATFSYILARSLGIGRAGATLGGLSFGFGGFLMAQVTNLGVMTGGVWLPLVFWGFTQALRTRRPVIALLGGVPLALHILAAHPLIPFNTALLLVGYALYQTVRIAWRPAPVVSRFREAAQVWVLLGLMFTSGLMLAAPQILPTWELQRLSVRAAGVDYERLTVFSLPPLQWLTLILPSVFGNSVTGYRGLASTFEETNAYAGLLPLVAALLSWRVRRRPEVLFLWLAALVSAWLAAGDYTPVYNLLHPLPGFNLFRAPARWSLEVNLALSVLAAYSFDDLLRRRLSRRACFVLTGVWSGATAILLAAWLFRQPLYAWTQTLPSQNDLGPTLRLWLGHSLFDIEKGYAGRIILGPLPWLVVPAVALVSRLGGAVALLVGYSAHRLPRQPFVVAAIALVAVDMSLAGGSTVNRLTGADHWQQLSGVVPYVTQAEQGGLERILTTTRGNEEEVIDGLRQYFPSVYHVFASGGYSSLGLMRYTVFVEQAHPLVMLSLSGTRFIVDEKGARTLRDAHLTADAGSRLPLVYQEREWYIYENPTVLPHAFIVHQVKVVASAEEALAPLRNRNFDGLRQAILETPETGESLPRPTPGPADGDRVTITRYAPSEVEIQADAGAAGFLVLLDNYYPGWQVYVDGRREEIIRADYFARAVYLDKGPHTVEFVYRPLSFRIGVGLSAAALWVLAVSAWLARRRQKLTPTIDTAP